MLMFNFHRNEFIFSLTGEADRTDVKISRAENNHSNAKTESFCCGSIGC